MQNFALHQNFTKYKNNSYVNINTIFPQRYWLNHSAATNSKSKSINKDTQNNKIFLLFLGLGLLFLSKGVQRKSKHLLENIKDHLENKAEKSFLKGSNIKTSFYDYTINKINSFMKKTDSINNFNSLKDILFMKFMYKTNPTKKIHQGISKFFEYLSHKTITKAYKKTQKKFDETYKNFDILDEYILKHHGDEIVEYKNKKYNKIEKLTKKELVERAKNFRKSVELVVNYFIAPEAQNTRYKYMKDSTSELYSKFWNESFKGFWSKENKFKRKEMWQTFIAAEQIKSNKTNLAEKAAFARNVLSYTDLEKKSYISEYLENLDSLIPIEDTEGKEIIKRLKWYVKDSTPLKSHKENFLQEADRLEKHKIKTSFDEKISKIQSEDKETNIRLIKEIVNDADLGEIGDMLNIYRRIAPFELSKSGALDSMKKAIKSFDESIKIETRLMFDKLRDLEIGSAPTDILTILISSAMIIRALGKTKNPDERDTIMLKSGIPVAGAILVSLISATRLISGTKSVILGIISGIILNRIGSIVAKYKPQKS